MNTSHAKPRFYALIPCAGTGSRAGTAVPKQYEAVAGRPMVMHTLAAFAAVDRLAATLLLVPPADAGPDCAGAAFSVARCGGSTRAVTVLNGLRELKASDALDSDWVLVHDAARCLVTPALIDRLIDACVDDDIGGLLAHPLADTLKHEQGGRVDATLPRDALWLAQTPQMFRIGLLIRALEQADAAVTDEAGAVEALGLQPLLVPGSAQNFKITYPDDFPLADALLRSRQA